MSTFAIDVRELVCADLGSNVGGFVDCLLQRGASNVYAIDTGYGALAWKLRQDPRVVVMERTNAMHARLPEKVGLVTIDVAWTKQRHILGAARAMLDDRGAAVTLIKPHYEADPAMLQAGVLPPGRVDAVVKSIEPDILAAGFDLVATTRSPLVGGKSKGNVEVLAHLRPRPL